MSADTGESVRNNRRLTRMLVRKFDRDRFRAALFAPQPLQDYLLSVYAFNVELSRIPEQVSDPTLGEIRLQWWRDALTGTASGNATGHPVADLLAVARRRRLLPDALLRGMIDARAIDVGKTPMPDMNALEDYLERTAGAVFLLGSYILGERDDAAVRLARAGGIAFGLAGLMRALPLHAAQGRLFLPIDMLNAFGAEPAQIAAGRESEALNKVLAELRCLAAARLSEAAAHFPAIRPAARPAFLPLAVVRPSLKMLAEYRHRPLRHIVLPNPLGTFWGMWYAYICGRL